MMQPTDAAVSWLFVPGTRPDRFAKAAASGAHQIIIDLEDAVAPDLKTTALRHAVHWLADGGRAWVRINGVGTPWHDDELAELAPLGLQEPPGLMGLLVPKADALTMGGVAAAIPGVDLVALVETARGVRDIYDIAATVGVRRLAFGPVDYALDIGATDEAILDFARYALVLASRAEGLAEPIDGPTIAYDAPGVVDRDARHAHQLGFGGRLCIHPSQVALTHAAFTPDPEQLAWARRVSIEAERLGSDAANVFSIDGQMIDRPEVERAFRLLAAAPHTGEQAPE